MVGAETGRGSLSDPSQRGPHTIRPGSLAVAWALFLPDRLASALPSQCSGVGQCGFRSPTWGLSTSPRSTGSAPRSELASSPGEIFLERLNAVITPHFLLRLISYFSIKRSKSPSWKAARCLLWGGGGTGRQAALGKVRWSLPVILHEACLANQLPPPTPSHSQVSRSDVRVPSSVTWAAGSVQQLGLDSRPSGCGAAGALSPSPATLRTPPFLQPWHKPTLAEVLPPGG